MCVDDQLSDCSGALFIDGSVHLDSSLLEAGIRLSGEGQSSIDFISDAEFYEMPLKLCMQMKKPDVIFKLVNNICCIISLNAFFFAHFSGHNIDITF